jgi:hypothetical protein
MRTSPSPVGSGLSQVRQYHQTNKKSAPEILLPRARGTRALGGGARARSQCVDDGVGSLASSRDEDWGWYSALARVRTTLIFVATDCPNHDMHATRDLRRSSKRLPTIRQVRDTLFFFVFEIFGEITQDHFVERFVTDEIFTEDRCPLLRLGLPKNGRRSGGCIT